MLTSKQRAEFRAQANALETTLMVGKDGVTEAAIEEADRLLTARELIKGKVLEAALMSARKALSLKKMRQTSTLRAPSARRMPTCSRLASMDKLTN